MITRFISTLEKRLREPLPGEMAQRVMAPAGNRPFDIPHKTGKAGVLILILPRKGELSTLLIKRTEYRGPHSGQVSFPGGKTEDGDQTQVSTALRETFEETGVDSGRITVLGTLTPLYIPVSDLDVLPVVGFTPKKPLFKIDPKEVEYLIHVPLKRLTDSNIKTEKILHINGFTIHAPGYRVKDEFIWGATAMILSEFAVIISETGMAIR